MKIIAYTFSADCHCASCTVKRFGSTDFCSSDTHKRDQNGIRVDQEDSDGNVLHPVFSTDESPSSHCGTCGKEIQE